MNGDEEGARFDYLASNRVNGRNGRMKKPVDDHPSLHAAVIACAFIAAAVIILGSLSGDENSSLEAWVNRYQTLITGFFAIGAAYVTISQMQKTDSESERRHRELVRLQMRSERLIIERMLFPQFGELREHYKSLRGSLLDPMLAHGQPDRGNDRFFEFADSSMDMKNTCNEIIGILGRPAWVEAQSLFGGLLMHHQRELAHRLSAAIDYLPVIARYSSEETERRCGEEWRAAEATASAEHKSWRRTVGSQTL